MKRYIRMAIQNLANDDYYTQLELATDKDTTPDVLDQLADSSIDHIRKLVAQNPNVTVDTLLSSLNIDDGERSGQINTNYKITFNVRMEFFSTGFYFLFSNDVKPIVPLNVSDNDVIIPIYTDVMLKEDLNLDNGWDLFTSVSFQLEDRKDSVNFEEILNISIKEAIKYHLRNGLPLIDLIDIKIRRQGNLLFENADYVINWDKLTVDIEDKDYLYYTYTMYVSININYLNNLLKDLFNIKRFEDTKN